MRASSVRTSALVALGLLLSAPAVAQETRVLRAEVVRIVDGDTFEAKIELGLDVWLRRAVRLRGVDTPELRGKCPEERAAARRSRARLAELLSSGPVALADLDDDKFGGRVVARVAANGQDVAAALIVAGLARAYDGRGPRAGWCG